MKTLQDYKDSFFRSQRIHLNNAGLAPISRQAHEKIDYWSRRFFEEGFYSDHDYMADVLHSRQSLARLLNCHHEEIAFFQSTAGGLSQVAFTFGLKAEDEVLLWDQEYSSNLYPWQAACKKAGARLVLAPSLKDFETPWEKLLEHCTDKTKIVSVSWVQFQTGARTDIAALTRACHQRGIFVVVDVMQGLGLHSFDFKNWDVDAVAGGSHKWLTSAVGVGFLVMKRQHLSRFSALSVGSASYGTCDDPADLACAPKTDASKFEPGSKQVLEITALGASCDLLLEVGQDTIEQESLRLAAKLRRGLEAQGWQIHSAPTSAIVNFSAPSAHASSEFERLAVHKKIQSLLQSHPVNYALRGPGIRLSPHAFNLDEDIERTLDLLDGVLFSRSK